MKNLIVYSTIAGGFYVKNEVLEQAVNKARSIAGDDVWKRGFSSTESGGATAIFHKICREEDIHPVVFEGQLCHIGFVENRDDAGNPYPKLRVGVSSFDDDMLLSLDLKSDVAQRLLVKLDQCSPGDYVRISAWPTFVEKGGRRFINHAGSVKNADGKEIPVNGEFSAQVKQTTDLVETTLRSAGISDLKTIATAKATRRIQAYKDMLVALQARFVAQLESVVA